MDAGTRWMLRRGFKALAVGGIVAHAAGCGLTSGATGPVSRLQAPDDKPAPVTVSPPGAPTIQPAAAKLAEQATPQVRVVAVIGSDTFITDDEVWQLVRQRLIGLYSQPGFTPPDAIDWMHANGYNTVGVWYPNVLVIGFAYEYMAFVNGLWEITIRAGA